MRRAFLAAATPLLLAQGAHYEQGTLIAPVLAEHTVRESRLPEGIPTLAFIAPDGTRSQVGLPPELDGRLGRCERMLHAQGLTYAVGYVHVPLPGRAGVEALKQRYVQLPRRLYVHTPKSGWRVLADLGSDASYTSWLLLPLGADRFLYSPPGLAWGQGSASPFGVYRVEGGRLRLERLVDLGLGGPWYLPGARRPDVGASYRAVEGHASAWQVLRLPAGLCFLHRESRHWFLLDAMAERCLSRGRLGGDEAEQVLAAAPRPDGRILVATEPGRAADRFRAWMNRAVVFDTVNPPQAPAAQWLATRCQAVRPPGEEVERVVGRWRVLDPATGQAWEVAPPRDFTFDRTSFIPLAEGMAVLPDGRLEHLESEWGLWRRPRRLRHDWLDRLLKPFTHDWRKLEP